MNDDLIYKIFEDICKIENLKDKDGNWNKDAQIKDLGALSLAWPQQPALSGKRQKGRGPLGCAKGDKRVMTQKFPS